MVPSFDTEIDREHISDPLSDHSNLYGVCEKELSIAPHVNAAAIAVAMIWWRLRVPVQKSSDPFTMKCPVDLASYAKFVQRYIPHRVANTKK